VMWNGEEICDLGGNVWERVADMPTVIVGGGYYTFAPADLGTYSMTQAGNPGPDLGFRCVTTL